MIPAIGFMIGFYVLTRCVEILVTRSGAGQFYANTHVLAKVLAVATMCVTVLSLMSLAVGSAQSASDVSIPRF